MENTAGEKKGVYSSINVILAVLFGGPFVTGWLVGENFKELGEYQKGKIIKTVGIIVGLILFLAPPITFYLTQKTVPFGSLNIPVSALLVLLQGKKVREYLKNGGKERSGWPTGCIVFILINLLMILLSVLRIV